MPKPKKIPAYLTAEEIRRLFAVIESPRDRAIFRVTYHRGLRASEVGMIQVGDYHAGRLLIKRLKGSNGGEYELVKVERQALRAWIQQRGTEPGPLFPEHGKGIDRFQLNRLMKTYCKAAGIDRAKAHMHALKHSCGTHLSAREPDIVAVQDHLGHASIGNTRKYLAIANARRDSFAKKLDNWK
jgi:integrase